MTTTKRRASPLPEPKFSDRSDQQGLIWGIEHDRRQHGTEFRLILIKREAIPAIREWVNEHLDVTVYASRFQWHSPDRDDWIVAVPKQEETRFCLMFAEHFIGG